MVKRFLRWQCKKACLDVLLNVFSNCLVLWGLLVVCRAKAVVCEAQACMR
jgi:hypothetical protein